MRQQKYWWLKYGARDSRNVHRRIAIVNWRPMEGRVDDIKYPTFRLALERMQDIEEARELRWWWVKLVAVVIAGGALGLFYVGV